MLESSRRCKSMDLISNLPDEIICHIGSFLSAKEAAFTTALSKKWRNLFTIIPKLHYDGLVDDDDDDDDEESLKDFLDGVLALPVSTRIRTFSLKCNRVAKYDDHINRCLCEVVKRGVMVFILQIKVGYYSLPLEIFTCKTVEKMKLGSGFALDGLPADGLLPALKTLSLDSVGFYNDFGGRCAFQALVSASPVLEELVMDGIEWERWKWSWVVSSQTLQRLTIRRRDWCSYDRYDDENIVLLDSRGLAYDFDGISLDTPRLTYLEYSDYVPKEYRIVNLSSLVEAKLDLRADEDSVWGEDEHADNFDPKILVNGLKDVEILDLTIETMEMLYVFREALPVFGKLYQLSLSLSNFCWFTLPVLIQKSPNLKTLIIEDSFHLGHDRELVCESVSETCDTLSRSLQVLKIKEYGGSMEELEQMKHFLEKLSCLELVEVHAQVPGNKKLQVMADLLMLPRVSSKCKIQIKFTGKRY